MRRADGSPRGDWWWALRASNQETRYGYGLQIEAARWADILDAGRDTDLYGLYDLGETDKEAEAHEYGHPQITEVGVDLATELAALEEIRLEEAPD